MIYIAYKKEKILILSLDRLMSLIFIIYLKIMIDRPI